MGGRGWLIPGFSAYLIHMKDARDLTRKRVLLLLFSALLSLQELPAQEPVRGQICLVWYNVENLFHPEDDSAAFDDEFTPGGVRNWTWTRYRNKITALARVIIASGRGDPPELVGLCEVENARVLEDLCNHPILSPYQYSYFHRESGDLRGMDVACLVRLKRIRIIHWECLAFAPPVPPTRSMMHMCLAWQGDSLDLFLVHLLSKYRGAGATASLRREQTGQLVRLMDSVFAERQEGRILATGDFNDHYQGFSMEPLRMARFGADTLTPRIPARGGTYKYRGSWEPIDQVLVQQSIPASVKVGALGLGPLLTEDVEYGGRKPWRCYEGYSYAGGISDHLPLLIDLNPVPGPDPAPH